MALKMKNNGIASIIRVGWFLALRQIRRGNIWTNVLIISIMMFTFLNLVVVSGILVGLIEGAVQTIRNSYTGDIFISNLKQKEYIDRSVEVIGLAKSLPETKSLTARYLEAGTVRSQYRQLVKPNTKEESVGAVIVGIDPTAEDSVTGLAGRVVEGEYLEAGDYDKVMVGAMLLKQYLGFDSEGFPTLSDVAVGSRIQVSVNGVIREVVVKGILRTKADEIDRRVFFTQAQLRSMISRFDYNVDEIALRLTPGSDPNVFKKKMLDSGAGQYAKIQTQEDAEPKFIKDMKQTFAMLGSIMGSIGLVIASITIFIVIFINAITRRKSIGILKGVGIKSSAIVFSYIIQSIFYATAGTLLGCLLVFGFLKPYLDVHPINFPFSDGILVATLNGTLIRIAVLFIATLVAGYIPARMVVRQNTLDSILGR